MNGFNSELLNGITRLHFIGIGGSGMFPLVQILHTVGYQITGSDCGTGDIVEREKAMGITVYPTHDENNVKDAQLVIYSAAISEDNPERIYAQQHQIPCVERSILLGYVANTYPHPICISGTHGKTTTTAMTTQIMLSCHTNASAIIGGKLPLIDAYGHYGTGSEIVVEACEYHNTFLHLVPYVSVILNIDEDHLEFFKTMENLKASFRKFALLTQHCVVANLDDANTREVLHTLDRKTVTFGIRTPADYRAVHIQEYRPSFFSFDLQVQGDTVTHIELSVPGYHQIYNALAAFASASLFGCRAADCAQALAEFKGAGRRFEILGEKNGVVIADDYAHHPAELKATLESAMKMGYRKVWAVFQPFTYSRTQMLFDDFVEVLKIPDYVVMTPIMGSREKAEDYTISTQQLVDKIPNSLSFSTFTEISDYLLSHAQEGDLILTLGCGDIYKAAKMMLEHI